MIASARSKRHVVSIELAQNGSSRPLVACPDTQEDIVDPDQDVGVGAGGK
jgi:hypothetical protein